MKAEKKIYEMNMCEGPLFGKIIMFSLPLMCSSILQLLFNAVDMIVVGQFGGKESLAAVGATSSLINLLINMFVGLSVGANVLIARYYGARQNEEIEKTVHTAITLSLIGGVILAVLGSILAKPLLSVMGCPANVIDLSALYMRIYFMGMPVVLLYNYGSSILRAIGDTKRPLYYLTIAGIVNVILNLLFVMKLGMDVAGVALATVISQCVSATLLVRCLTRMEGGWKLNIRKLYMDKEKVMQILQTGLPAGLQGSVFSLSNVVIQSSLNTFGSVAMAGSSAAANIEGFVYVAMNAFHQSAQCFTSQNLGGGKYKRINQVLMSCLIAVTVAGIVFGGSCYLFGEKLVAIYNSDPNVIRYGVERLRWICLPYFLFGIMDVLCGQLRGLGQSVAPMVVSIGGVCGLRILWVYTVFAMAPSLPTLYASYPVTWVLTSIAHAICYIFIWKKMINHLQKRKRV